MGLHPISKHVDNIDRIIDQKLVELKKTAVLEYLINVGVFGECAVNIVEHYFGEDDAK